MPSHPTKIGKYTIEGILGRGGMGVVYKAVDSQIGRYVAIKMITSNGDPNLLERFKAEGRSMGSLQCPNIVTVYDFGEQDGNPYLVMQFLEGSSLESLIQKGVSLTLPERLAIMIDTCNGLAYAHQRGVIHRDIKPGNIMVLQDGVNDGMAVIVDFGIARIGDDTRLTQTNQIVGSVHYMSPEQLQAQELDNRTDIYAAGVVLFQLLTGALPFDAPDKSATLFQIVHEPPPPLGKYLKEYPPELDAIVSRALAKKRDERYGTAKDFAFDLEQVQERVRSDTVAQLVQRAEVSIAREDWTKAREYLQQVLRIDRQNTQAQKSMNALQQRLRQQQQIEQAHGMRVQADEAFLERRFDDALRLLDQALTLDSKNDSLLAFRDTVRLEKEKATGLRRALRRAESALQDGDVDEAQSAIDDVFKLDPNDSQATALKAIISQHAEERLRQKQLRTLLDQARNQIAARNFSEAFATLKTAEALDPASSELQSVVKMAVSAREQEKRRMESEELRRNVEGALIHEDFAGAIAKANDGLQKFPQDQSLAKLKALAEAQQIRVEHKKFVREQAAAVSALLDSSELAQASMVVESALQRAPGNSELETLRSTIQDRLMAEEAGRQKLRGVEQMVSEGKRVLQERGARAAREFLDTRAGPYADFPQIRELRNAVTAREAMDTLDGQLAAETNPARRVQLVEEAERSNPDNKWIQQRLAELLQVRSLISAAIDRAETFEAAGNLTDALGEWHKLKADYPEVSEFEAQIKRIASLQLEQKKPQAIARSAPSPTLPEPPIAAHLDGSLSATRVLRTPLPRDSGVTPKPKSPVIGKAAEIPAARNSASPPIVGVITQMLRGKDLRRQATTLLVGPNRYLVIAAAVVLLAAGSYLLSGGRKTSSRRPNITGPVQVQILTSPPDALVTSDSKPVTGNAVSLVPGAAVPIEVAHLGYKTKHVEIRQASDGAIDLEPEPLHLSIQTSEKNGIVELDGQQIGDLSDGSMDEYDLIPDGKTHKLSVTVRRKPLFAVELRAEPGSPAEVTAFSADGLFLITTLGEKAKLYAGSFLKNVRVGGENVAISSSGVDLKLSDKNNEIKFGEGAEQGSMLIDISNAPTLVVHSTTVEGQVQVEANVEDAILSVDGNTIKRLRHRWKVSRPPGTYNFSLSADGYETQKWTMTLERRQTLTKNIELKAKVVVVSLASLLISGGTPGAEVLIDGQRAGELDSGGNLQVHNLLSTGLHSIRFAKQYHESRTFEVTAKLPEVRLQDVILTPWPSVAFQTPIPNVIVKYQRTGDTQEHEMAASAKIKIPPGQYTFLVEATGFQKFTKEIKLNPGEEVDIPLKLDPIPDFEFQDPAQVIHDGSWMRAKDSHKMVYLKPGFTGENLIFSKPGKNLFWSKKVEWVIETVEGSVRLQYTLEGQKLVRKLVVEQETSDAKESKVEAASAKEPTSLSIHIQVDGSHVLISNDKGGVLDDYPSPKHNLSASRIGFRTDSRFLVRSDQK